jgi:transposase
MGRSRGGLTTKIHALTDARGLPLELILTPGQAGDCPVAACPASAPMRQIG